MAERIDLEVPASVNALSTVRMVLGALGVRLDFSLDDLEDLYLATDELLRAALAVDAFERLSVRVLIDGGVLSVAAGEFTSARLRDDVTVHTEDSLDLCMLLRSTVDEVTLEDQAGAYRVILVKGRRGGLV